MYVGIDVFLKVSPHRNVPGGAYIVVQRMPERDGEFEYRVKSSIEPRERVVGDPAGVSFGIILPLTVVRMQPALRSCQDFDT